MPSPRRASALWMLAADFALLGALGATWVSRIPAEASRLHLSTGRLGLALLGLPVGSVLASAVAPRVLRRYHPHRVIATSLLAGAAVVCALPVTPDLALLAVTLGVFGAAQGAVDVSMNAHGVLVQQSVGRSIFGRLHASWSLGSFVGAGTGALCAHLGVTTEEQFVAVAAVVAAAGWLLPDPVVDPVAAADAVEVTDPAEEHRWSWDPRVLAMAAVAATGFVVEVGVADWSGVFVRRGLAGGTAAAAASYAVFSALHFLLRVSGDPVVDRVPRRTLLSGSLVVAAAGLALVVTTHSVGVALAGFAVTGAGISLVVPIAFAGAGAVPGVAASSGVATAAGISYVAWTATPPAIGGIAAAAGLRVGLALPLALASVLALSLAVPRRRRAAWDNRS